MPTYEYICSACQHAWEAFQSINAEPQTECPHCHESTAQRQISLGGGFILKGGGWYSDLYASPARPKGEGSGSSSEGGSGESKGGSTVGATGEATAGATPKPSGGGDTSSSKPAATPATAE